MEKRRQRLNGPRLIKRRDGEVEKLAKIERFKRIRKERGKKKDRNQKEEGEEERVIIRDREKRSRKKKTNACKKKRGHLVKPLSLDSINLHKKTSS